MSDLLEGLNGPTVSRFSSSPTNTQPSDLSSTAGTTEEGRVVESPQTEADVVTLDPVSAVATRGNLPRGLTRLYAVLDQLGGGAQATGRSGNGATRGVLAGLRDFSARSAFSNSRSLGLGAGVGAGRLNNLMDRLDQGFDNLMNLDPVLGGNLAVLLRALAVLDRKTRTVAR
jgi:hypothetical protein